MSPFDLVQLWSDLIAPFKGRNEMIDIPENTVGSILRAQAELIRELQTENNTLYQKLRWYEEREERDELKQK
jgi:hypothetical protein